jgi:uncharacterized membrane protein YdjX (TVP38/TMEM64 family)
MDVSQSEWRLIRLRRWLPLLLLAGMMALTFGLGWHELISLKTIGLNYEALRAFIRAHLAIALLIYIAVYVAVVALSIPGAAVLTISGGLLFGWKIGAPAALVAATAGATILFLVTRSCEEALTTKAGPWLAKLREGFREHALSYLLFLRLVPVFPFFVVNIAPALLGVPLPTYVLGTFLGIMPGTLAFSVAGAGLGSVIKAQNRAHAECLASHPGQSHVACPYAVDTGKLLTPELIAAFVLLGIVALIPVAVRMWNDRHAKAK